ncbi:thiol-disulfide oxidoreductase DCC family protein [Vibrio rotiferianus]|jgi:predicted DCC family thiol-disulfide oxidoreductase YuxK|uniref:thiol-disulfide oxidoreductase DCC family protein n=1 Tax=Vibrio rotiferianus TaxID=190895 RepID=UPI00406A7308
MTKLTVFYDGTCPLCAKEMEALKQRDAEQQIKIINIYSDAFADYPQIDPEQANTILHALNQKGELLLGLDVTHRAWQLVGRGWLYAPLRWRIVKPVADWLYLKFAKNRYRVSYLLTGKSRCNTNSCTR